MMKNRIMVIALIIAASVFAGFFGGSLSYGIFYASIAVPLLSFCYVLLIYIRLKVYQTIVAKTMVKGENIKYRYTLANEDYIFCKSVKVKFMSDYSKVEEDSETEISLIPGEKREYESTLTCLYRGEYKVGIESVTVKDCLNLFSMVIEKPSVINARVYPKIIKLSSLNALNFSEDVKSNSFNLSQRNEVLDSELKLFTSGDNIKAINWRASAHSGELLSRRYTQIPKDRVIIFLDLSPVYDKMGDKIIIEDALLETVLAISEYYRQKQTASEICFYSDKEYRFNISDNAAFNAFYEYCSTLCFNSQINAGEYIRNRLPEISNFSMMIAVTCHISEDMLITFNIAAESMQTCIIQVGNNADNDIKELNLKLKKTKLINIPENADISKILSN